MSPRRQNWYRRIMRFYLYRNPEQATPEQVHRVLQQFEKVGYEKMIVLLVKKYGPEPDPPRIQQRRHSEITTNDLQHKMSTDTHHHTSNKKQPDTFFSFY
eukprot:PhF_6_TR4222/c1_g1_i2/m.5695